MPSMGCQKLTYQNLETQLKVVYKKRLLNEKVVQLWLSVDPLSDLFPSTSPYMYVAGNPINLIDRWGLAPEKGNTAPPMGPYEQNNIPNYSTGTPVKKRSTSSPTLPSNWSASRTINYSSAKPNLTLTQMNKNRKDFYSRPKFNLNYNKTIRREPMNTLSNSTISSYGFTTLSLITGKVISIVNSEAIRQQLYNNIIANQVKNMPGGVVLPFKLTPTMKFIGRWGGTPFAVWGYFEIKSDYRAGNLSFNSMIIEQASNAAGIIPVFGTAWSVGWNAGKKYGPSTLFNFNY